MRRRGLLKAASAFGALSALTNGYAFAASKKGPEDSHPELPPHSKKNVYPTKLTPEDYLYRPSIHFTPPSGFMNDPNGLIYDGTNYHLFYQHDPDAPYAGNVHWGHAISSDLYSWKDLPEAVAPTKDGMAFTGCAVFDTTNTSNLFPSKGGNPALPNFALIYTRATDKKQSQYLAVSHDGGKTFSEGDYNPIVDIHSDSFRDPKVFFHKPSNRWIMTVVQARKHKVSFYGSYNLKNWMHLSDFGSAGLFGVDYECPNLIEVALEGTNETRWLMFISINPGAPQGGSVSQYFVGFFDGERFTAEDQHTVSGLTDFCKDSYALQTYENLPISEATLIAWLGNWQYCEQVPHTGWRGAMTIPRRISVRRDTDGWIRLVQNPVGLEKLRGTRISTDIKRLEPTQTQTVSLPTQTAIEVCLSVSMEDRNTHEPDGEQGRAGRFMLVLGNKGGESLTIGFDAFSCQLWLDRGNLKGFSNPFFTDRFSTALTPDDRKFKLRLVYDASTLEVFINDGISVGTALVYPKNPIDQLQLITTNTAAKVTDLQVYPLRKTMPRPTSEAK